MCWNANTLPLWSRRAGTGQVAGYFTSETHSSHPQCGDYNIANKHIYNKTEDTGTKVVGVAVLQTDNSPLVHLVLISTWTTKAQYLLAQCLT